MPPLPPHHGNDACNTAECVDGYGAFAAATVAHFKGNSIIFECLNEPNGMGNDNASVRHGTHCNHTSIQFTLERTEMGRATPLLRP